MMIVQCCDAVRALVAGEAHLLEQSILSLGEHSSEGGHGSELGGCDGREVLHTSDPCGPRQVLPCLSALSAGACEWHMRHAPINVARPDECGTPQ